MLRLFSSCRFCSKPLMHRGSWQGSSAPEASSAPRKSASLPNQNVAFAPITVSASDSAELPDAGLASVPRALVAAGDQLPPGLLPVMLELHFRHLLQAEMAAILSQLAGVGTSGRAAPPYKQMRQQSPP